MGQDIDPFRAITISKRAHELKEEGRSILHMEFGQPSTPAPKAAIARSHEVLDTDPMGYWESQPLKARICQHYKDMYGVDLTPGRLAITNGASPALVLALATAFSPGDRIAFARPGYVAYRNTVRALNFEGVEIPCGEDTRYQLSAAALDALDPAPQGVIIARGGPADGFALSLANGRPAFHIRSSDKLTTVTAKKRIIGGWHHIAGVLDTDKTMKIYVDGELSGEGQASALISTDPLQPMEIGTDGLK